MKPALWRPSPWTIAAIEVVVILTVGAAFVEIGFDLIALFVGVVVASAVRRARRADPVLPPPRVIGRYRSSDHCFCCGHRGHCDCL